MSAKKSPRKNVRAGQRLEAPTLRLAGAPETGTGETPPKKLGTAEPGNSVNGHAAGHPLTTKKKAGKTAVATSPKSTKAAKTRAKKAADAPPKKLSALDAAVRVLEETKHAMTCSEMIEAMSAKRYWTSPGGKTPAATLYSAILRELNAKGKDSRFKKTERGKFKRA